MRAPPLLPVIPSECLLLASLALSCALPSWAGEEGYTRREVGAAKAEMKERDQDRADVRTMLERNADRWPIRPGMLRHLGNNARMYCSPREVRNKTPAFIIEFRRPVSDAQWGAEQPRQEGPPRVALDMMTGVGGQAFHLATDSTGRKWILDPATILAFETLTEPLVKTPKDAEDLARVYASAAKLLDSEMIPVGQVEPKVAEWIEANRASKRAVRAHLPGRVNVYFSGEDVAAKQPTFSAVVVRGKVEMLGQTYATVSEGGVVRWLINTNCVAFENLDQPAAGDAAPAARLDGVPAKANVYFRGDGIGGAKPAFSDVTVLGQVQAFGRPLIEIEDAKKVRWLVNPTGAVIEDAADENEIRKRRQRVRTRTDVLMEGAAQAAIDAARASGEKDTEKLKAIMDRSLKEHILRILPELLQETAKEQQKAKDELKEREP